MEVTATELKALEAAMKGAFEKMTENLKKAQDTADGALAESKKLGGVIEAKTSDKLKELDENRVKLQDQFLALRAQVLDVAQKLSTRPQGGSGEEQKGIHQMIVESDEWKAIQGKSARYMDPVKIGSFHKATILNATLNNDQPLVQAHRVPGLIVPAEQRLTIRDLLPQSPTDTNLIEFASEATFTNAAAPQGAGSSPTETEGQIKAESSMTFTLASVPVITVAHWIPASRQVLSDAKMLQGHINARLIYGLKLEEEEELLTGTGASGQLTGLNTGATAYNRGATNDTILDTLLKAMLQVSLSNYEASGVILNPIDWVSAMLLKDSQNRYLFTNPQDMVAPRVWSKPVVATQSQTQGKFTVGAFSLAAQIWDREDATVRISENVDNHFIRNLVAILAEERLALAIYRATAIVYGNTSHAG